MSATKEPKVGHDYMPNWISVPFNVTYINSKAVFGEFYTGQRRSFKLQGFMDSFKHDKDCIACRHIKA